MFLVVTTMDGTKRAVNKDHIKHFEPCSNDDNSIIIFINKDYLHVKESFEQLCVSFGAFGEF